MTKIREKLIQEFLKENSTKNKSIYTYIPIQSFLL